MKSYYVVIKCAFCHIYAVIFIFLAMNSFDVKIDDVSIFNHFVTMYCLVTLSVLSKTVSSN